MGRKMNEMLQETTELAMTGQWEELWTLTLRLLDETPESDTEQMAAIAAGPLEDIVRYEADAFEARIAERIRADAKFRRAMTGVWAREERAEFWARMTPLLYEYPTDPIDGWR